MQTFSLLLPGTVFERLEPPLQDARDEQAREREKATHDWWGDTIACCSNHTKHDVTMGIAEFWLPDAV